MRERWLTSKAMAFPERLKRGLGSAFLDALELPRQEVHEHLYRCITRDPRCDGQIEHRADYYALLALHTGLPVGRLADHLRRRDDESQFTSRTSLTIETLIRLATRGSAEARETLRQYISWGQWWDWALEGLVETGDASAWDDLLPAILTRFPTPDELSLEIRMITRVPWDVWSGDPCVSEALTLARERARPDSLHPLESLPTSDLLAAVAIRSWFQVELELARRDSEQDRQVMLAALDPSEPQIAAVALLALGRLGDVRIMDFAVSRLDDSEPPWPNRLRGASGRALARLPRDVVLPLAREWRDSPWPARELAASNILERHATEEDLGWARAELRGRMNCDRGEISSALRVIETIGPAEPVPEVGRIFDLVPYSYARRAAARVLAFTDPEWASGRAFHSLWDCEDEVRAVAAGTVALSVGGAEPRLRQMAVELDEVEKILGEDKSPREAAAERLSLAAQPPDAQPPAR